MKKIILSTISIIGFIFIVSGIVFAQGHTARAALADEGEPRLDHTRREEAEGKIVWEKLQAKELTCKDLSNDDFGTLGEYFMGQTMGDSHEAMNNMMIQMMGEEGEEQMHIAMGKRTSNCEPDAPMPPNMMNNGMMGGGSNSMMGNFGTNPMGRNFGFFGWIFMILWWFLIIAGIVALIKWLVAQSRGESHGHEKSSLDILKERYARGEIDKKEFEDKKKDLS